MDVAAVRNSVRELAGDMSGCPAGHRFNLYLEAWQGHDWSRRKEGKADAARRALQLGDAAAVLEGIRDRQAFIAARMGARPGQLASLVLDTVSTSPFATGLGMEHPIENGFAFLTPYGLPYLAGSGVKGVLRHAARQLEEDGLLDAGTTLALFGHDADDDPRRGAVVCWDVFPAPQQGKPGQLQVEVMTPHFRDYYRGEGGSPHDSGSPNPIPFLAVPPGWRFKFVLLCNTASVAAAMPGLDWESALRDIATHAFDWLGFGAKTATGYGVLREDPEAAADQAAKENELAREQAAKENELAREQARKSKSANRLQVDDLADKAATRFGQLRGGLLGVSDAFLAEFRDLARKANESTDWTHEEKTALADAIEEWLPKLFRCDMKDQRKKLGVAKLRGQA
jgi:CRISPR-associated protein Cmr6